MATVLSFDQYVMKCDEKHNTVYEFLGNKWHGNLDVFQPEEKCHPFNDKTAKELNDEWIKRANQIKSMGYNLTYIWEMNYKDILNGR